MTARSPRRLLAALAAVLLLAACGEAGDDPDPEPTPGPTPTAEPDASPTPTPTATPDPTPAPEPEPAETDPADDPEEGAQPLAGEPATDEREADAEAGTVAVTDVRVGSHDGFDRIVLETAGDGAPGWFVRYVDQARTAGRGDVVELEGEAVLSIGIRGATLPPELPEDLQPVDFDRIDGPPGGVVTEVVADTIFEGIHSFFAGLTGEHPFVVERLEDPTRVVIDVFPDGSPHLE